MKSNTAGGSMVDLIRKLVFIPTVQPIVRADNSKFTLFSNSAVSPQYTHPKGSSPSHFLMSTQT